MQPYAFTLDLRVRWRRQPGLATTASRKPFVTAADASAQVRWETIRRKFGIPRLANGQRQRVKAVGASTWSAAAVPESVRLLRTAVFEFADRAGVPDPPLGRLRLAVSEAVTNVVMHAYRHDAVTGAVEVAADFRQDELRVVVSDRGAGFASRSDSPGAGFGLLLVKELADGVDIRPVEPRGTALHMSFKVA